MLCAFVGGRQSRTAPRARARRRSGTRPRSKIAGARPRAVARARRPPRCRRHGRRQGSGPAACGSSTRHAARCQGSDCSPSGARTAASSKPSSSKAAEARRQPAERSYQAASWRGDDIDDDTEPCLRCEREARLGFAVAPRPSGSPPREARAMIAVAGIRSISDDRRSVARPREARLSTKSRPARTCLIHGITTSPKSR